jgi:predicted enzyme related to lactoylglutathione lyase
MAAKVIQFEVTGRDAPALQKFYSELFGWKFDTNNPGGYGMSDANETGVTVGVGAAPAGAAGQVTGYVTVSDIDATLAAAERLGGKTIMPKFTPGGNAWIALFVDPEGHVMGLTQV